MMETLGWKTIPQGVRALIKLQEEHNWLVESPRETMQNLFNHCRRGTSAKRQELPPELGVHTLQAGTNNIHQEQPFEHCTFVEHEVMIQKEKVHMFSVQHDPGNDRYAYMADDIWSISFAGFTRPNPNSIGNVIETLLSLWCLAPSFPELIGQLGLERIKSHTKVWTEDLLAAKAESAAQGQDHRSSRKSWTSPGSCRPPQTRKSSKTRRSRRQQGTARGRRKKKNPTGATRETRGWNPGPGDASKEIDTVETAPGLAGALLGFAQALKETTARIERPRQATCPGGGVVTGPPGLHQDGEDGHRRPLEDKRPERRRTTPSTPSGSRSSRCKKGRCPLP